MLRTQIEESELIADLDRQIEGLKTAREEENVTIEQRISLDNQVLALEQQRFRILQAGAIARRDQLEAQAELIGGVNKLTDDQLKILIDSRNEVKNLEAEYSTRIRKIKSDIDSLNDSLRKQNEELRKETSADDRAQRRALDTLPGESDPLRGKATKDRKVNPLVKEGEQIVLTQERINADLLKLNKKFYEEDLANKKKFSDLKEKVDQAQLMATSSILGAASSLFDQQSTEYKLFATAQTLISTYATAQKAAEAAFTPPTIASPGLAAAYVATAIANGLAQVAAINGVQFAEGGWTGPGNKMDVAGVVHADEYVAPKHIVNTPAAQPHIAALESMRLRPYADGGFVTNQNTASTQQAMITANALKNMKQPIVGVREFIKVWEQVQWRENVSQR